MAESQVAVAGTVAELRRHCAGWRGEGQRIGLVPTMGALHAGHRALIRRARAECGRVAVSIFVNPKQFGPREDFAAYPRPLADDLKALGEEGADLAYVPAVDEIYPAGFSTTVSVAGLSDGLCGAARPGHFDGVATVVAKLLIQALPDAAYFGEKDYQQLMIVKRLTRDLDIPVEIVGVPTVREADGLALSSRNVYLSAAERRIAPLLHRTLCETAAAGADAAALAQAGARLREAGFAVEYLELRDAETLAPLGRPGTRPARLLAAVRLGRTRLIDNIAVSPM